VLFADGTDNYWARQQVLERIAQAEIPADAKPQLGPLASAIGEVYRYTLESTSMPLPEVKALQDWTIEREFKKVPGVADIVSWGGGIKQYQITVDPDRLRAYNLTLKQVFDAVAGNNSNAGGSYIRQGEYALMVRGIGLIQTTKDIVVAAQKGTPVRVRDIGTVGIGTGIRLGILGKDHDDDLVQGIILMRKGENPGKVIEGVRKKIEEVQKVLPAGVQLKPYYSRDRLVRTTVTTVMRNLVKAPPSWCSSSPSSSTTSAPPSSWPSPIRSLSSSPSSSWISRASLPIFCRWGPSTSGSSWTAPSS